MPPASSIAGFGCNSFAFLLYTIVMVFETLSYPLQHLPLQNKIFKTFLSFPHEAAAQAAF